MKKISVLFLGLLTVILMSAFAAAETIFIDFEGLPEYYNLSKIVTPYGDIEFYMVDSDYLTGLSSGDIVQLVKTGELPVIAESDNIGPNYTNIVAYTTYDGSYHDEHVINANGNDLGIKMLTDTTFPEIHNITVLWDKKIEERTYVTVNASDSYGNISEVYLVVSFENGSVYDDFVKSTTRYVWCVRGGHGHDAY